MTHAATQDSPDLRFVIDPETGALTSIVVPGDPESMNWIGETLGWGRPMRFRDGPPEIMPLQQLMVAEGNVSAIYADGDLVVEAERSLDEQGNLREKYTFRNGGPQPVQIDSGTIGIRWPFVDNYEPGAAACCRQRCHAHLWAEGSSAWVCLLRMGTTPPHLGLVLTAGQLDGYSVVERGWQSNDRGVIVVHPVVGELPAGGSVEVSWTLFSHTGWDDFFAKARVLNPAFVRLQADKYAVPARTPIQIKAEGPGLVGGEKLKIDGQLVPTRAVANQLTLTAVFETPGEHRVELFHGNRREVLWLLVTDDADRLLRRRAEFLMEKKQVIDPGSPYDGAFPIFDLETGERFIDEKFNDHNPARERVGSGVLIGLLALREPRGEWRSRLEESFRRYYAFVNREIQDEQGVVHNTIRYGGEQRLYNWPWVLQAHLCAWELTEDRLCLQRFMQALRSYYAKGGDHFYAIGIPIEWSLKCLEQAGLKADRAETLAYFRRHADRIIATDVDIPAHEVKYEQSIMGPALQIVAETAVVTGEEKYKTAVERFLRLLEAFHGRQPHYRLHDIGIRHWDGYWFGKRQRYGDTMPHHWSTISADAFRLCARLGHAGYAERARQILTANFSNFGPNGEGYCAYLYPRTINGLPGRYNDPYDNDQDWALIHWLHFTRDQPL